MKKFEEANKLERHKIRRELNDEVNNSESEVTVLAYHTLKQPITMDEIMNYARYICNNPERELYSTAGEIITINNYIHGDTKKLKSYLADDMFDNVKEPIIKAFEKLSKIIPLYKYPDVYSYLTKQLGATSTRALKIMVPELKIANRDLLVKIFTTLTKEHFKYDNGLLTLDIMNGYVKFYCNGEEVFLSFDGGYKLLDRAGKLLLSAGSQDGLVNILKTIHVS